jgi:hypothetical protein
VPRGSEKVASNDEDNPVLEHLIMMSSTDDGMSVILPASLRAPLPSTPRRAVPLGPSNKTMKKKGN